MPRNVAQSTKSCAARISTEPSITPCGGIAIPTAAKRIAAENDAIDIYFFIGIVFFKTITITKTKTITITLAIAIFFNDNDNDNVNVGDNVGNSVGNKPLAISH